MKNKIGIFIGSLRKESFSRKLANHMIDIAPEQFEMSIIEIGHLPMYNQDYDAEASTPPSYIAFREEVRALDGFLFITPEYNRSYPAVIKNALDVGSRPFGKGVWAGKPGGVMSISIGGIGGFGANHHLRQVLCFLNVYLLQQPESYVGNISQYIDEEGHVINEITQKILQDYMTAFATWVEKH